MRIKVGLKSIFLTVLSLASFTVLVHDASAARGMKVSWASKSSTDNKQSNEVRVIGSKELVNEQVCVTPLYSSEQSCVSLYVSTVETNNPEVNEQILSYWTQGKKMSEDEIKAKVLNEFTASIQRTLNEYSTNYNQHYKSRRQFKVAGQLDVLTKLENITASGATVKVDTNFQIIESTFNAIKDINRTSTNRYPIIFPSAKDK